jgi:hypothetical protein
VEAPAGSLDSNLKILSRTVETSISAPVVPREHARNRLLSASDIVSPSAGPDARIFSFSRRSPNRLEEDAIVRWK